MSAPAAPARNGYVRMQIANVEAAIAQIADGKFPQYDDNARFAISEALDMLCGTLAGAQGPAMLAAEGVTLPIAIAGLTLDVLHAEDTLNEIAGYLRYVAIGLALQPARPSQCACWACVASRRDEDRQERDAAALERYRDDEAAREEREDARQGKAYWSGERMEG